MFEPKEFHRVFSGAIPPVFHIYPGDSVKTWSVDAGGMDAQGVPRSLGENPQTGPFYISVDVIPGKSVATPRAEDDEYLMAMGIAGSLTEAFQIATTMMARWLEESYKLNTAEVASVLGTAMRYDIAEVVDPYVNVVAKVPKKVLAQIPKANR